MAEQKFNCPKCKLRARYVSNSRSLLGRFWKWHTRICPGWKAYMASLSEEERKEIKQQIS